MPRVLDVQGRNTVRAAAVLGITRQTLAKRLGEHEYQRAWRELDVERDRRRALAGVYFFGAPFT